MRIAIVINTSWNIFNFRKGLVMSLLNQGHEVIAIAPQDEYSERLVEWGCEYIPLQMDGKGTNPIQDLRLIFRMKRLYQESRADVFLQFTIKPNIYGTLAAKMIGKPVLCNVSGLGTIFIHPDKLSSKIGKWLYKKAFKYPFTIFFQNEDDRELFVNNGLVNAEVAQVLPGSGVDLTYFDNPNPFTRNQPFRFLMISRLLKDKGVVEYAEAARLLHERYGNKVECCILGKVDDSKGSVPESELKNWIEQGWVKHLGMTDHVKEVVMDADCIVLPSYREGTPRTLLEALALSKPIVTTNVPGCKETVINEKNGYICTSKSATDLENKMNWIYNSSPEDLKQMGEESRKLAENRFNENIVIDHYLRKLDEIYKKQAGGSL